jgi:hypothetical protein
MVDFGGVNGGATAAVGAAGTIGATGVIGAAGGGLVFVAVFFAVPIFADFFFVFFFLDVAAFAMAGSP